MLRPNFPDGDRNPLEKTYEVIVGHARVKVSGASRDEAIEQARSRLCLELPRMWDVIQSLDIQRFEVRHIGE